jgi:hypothetical protein
VGNTVSIVTGAALGGICLSLLQSDVHAMWLPDGWSPFLLLFFASSAARLVALPLLARIPRLDVEITVPAVRILSVRPDGSEPDPPVLPSLPDRAEGMPRN